MARQSGQSSCLLGKVVESEKKEKLDLIVATKSTTHIRVSLAILKSIDTSQQQGLGSAAAPLAELQVVVVDRLGSAQRDQQQLFSS